MKFWVEIGQIKLIEMFPIQYLYEKQLNKLILETRMRDYLVQIK